MIRVLLILLSLVIIPGNSYAGCFLGVFGDCHHMYVHRTHHRHHRTVVYRTIVKKIIVREKAHHRKIPFLPVPKPSP